MLQSLFPNASHMVPTIIKDTVQTIYMTGATILIGGVIGLIIGVLLVITSSAGITPNRVIYSSLNKIVNFFRSIPFIILLAVIAPFTRMLVGSSIGTTAAVVPLTIGCIPFYARQVQTALLDVNQGVVEAAQSMGASNLSIIFRVYLKESLPALIRTSVLTIITAISMTAMAGTVGGGGLGNLAIMDGYDRFEPDVTVAALIVILILVFVIQLVGDVLARLTDHVNMR